MMVVPYSVSRIKVGDYAKFKPVFDQASAMRKSYGAKGTNLFRDVDSPNDVIVFIEWANLEDARKFFKSDDLKNALQRSGAIKSEFYLLNSI